MTIITALDSMSPLSVFSGLAKDTAAKTTPGDEPVMQCVSFRFFIGVLLDEDVGWNRIVIRPFVGAGDKYIERKKITHVIGDPFLIVRPVANLPIFMI